jgi:hypothetical protein
MGPENLLLRSTPIAPFFWADSQWIGFEPTGYKMNKISVEGGAVVPVADGGGLYPMW